VSDDAVWTERAVRTGISATKFCVRGEDAVPAAVAAHSHEHHHHSHPHDHHGHGPDHHHADDGHDDATNPGANHDHDHRTLPEIYRLIDGSLLSLAGKERARSLFARLGEAEAAIHGTTIDRVHLHEVGALDSIVDIVGTVFALEWLGVTEVVASPLNVGSGMVRSAHGTYPVPAPATLRLLTGVPVYSGPQQAELVTPTGALLVSAYATRYGSMPEMRIRGVGYGAGTRDFRDTPNVLRVVLGDVGEGAQAHAVSVIECEIDDMNPQIFGALMDRVLAAGALDVFYTPVQMKKNRPGTLLTIVAPPARRDELTALVFRETTTIGVRYREMTRECLERREVRVDTPLGPVRFKVASRQGEVLNAAPEFDDLLAIAASEGRPVKDVQALAMKAFLDRPSEIR
jgi:pyridinium-3,5-bisthiocarboxylic acid mononucleotide nickel chelatase